jgi:hypothetical protein
MGMKTAILNTANSETPPTVWITSVKANEGRGEGDAIFMKLENSTTYHKNPTFVLQHFKL